MVTREEFVRECLRVDKKKGKIGPELFDTQRDAEECYDFVLYHGYKISNNG